MGELYLRGLLLDGKRKSMQPMAAGLRGDHQQLQQFVTTSTWDYAEVRGRLARWAAAALPTPDSGSCVGSDTLVDSDTLVGIKASVPSWVRLHPAE
jgi:SRSO17 transposase